MNSYADKPAVFLSVLLQQSDLRYVNSDGERFYYIPPDIVVARLVAFCPNMMELAAAEHAAAQASEDYIGVASGEEYRNNPLLRTGNRLALLFSFDYVTTSRNSKSRASKSRSWGVLCLAIANVPGLMLTKKYIVPVMVFSKKRAQAAGFTFARMFAPLRKSLERLRTGTCHFILLVSLCGCLLHRDLLLLSHNLHALNGYVMVVNMFIHIRDSC